jgi:hypothetical protein
MADLKSEAEASNSNKPNDFVPFKPGAARYAGKDVSFADLAPQVEPEPGIEAGVDLKGKKKIIFAAGRGKTGKTTLLRWLTEKSVRQGAQPILADIDPSNASFSRYFENVARPDTDNPAGVAHWLQELIEHCITEKQSAVIDLGGGDTTLRTLATEMPGLSVQIEAAGIVPVMLYMLGTQPEDLTPALTLAERGFATTAQALVLNEVAIDAGVTRSMAFARILNSPSFLKLTKSSVTVWMPRLFAADAIESRFCGFHDARDVRVEPPLGVFDSARVRAWLEAMDRRFAGIDSWIP